MIAALLRAERAIYDGRTDGGHEDELTSIRHELEKDLPLPVRLPIDRHNDCQGAYFELDGQVYCNQCNRRIAGDEE